MQFKVHNTSVKISFSFFALVLFFYVTDNLKIYLISLLCALIHETVHVIFIILFGESIESISFSLTGGNIIRNNFHILPYYKEAIINICAPLFNILLSLILTDFKVFSQINLILGVFNILPFYSFDGGHCIENLLLIKFKYKSVDIILTISSLVVTIVLSIGGFFVFMTDNNNISLIILAAFCLISIIFKK